MKEPITERTQHPYELISKAIRLDALLWSVVDPTMDPQPPIPCTQREQAEQTIQLPNREVKLEVEHMRSEEDIRELYIFTIIDKQQAVLQIRLAITHSKSGVFVSSNVGKIPETSLPGMPLYKKILDYIQLLANQRQVPMTHLAKRSAGETALGRHVLDEKAWNAKFRPLFQERGYQEVKDFVWKKTYSPVTEQG